MLYKDNTAKLLGLEDVFIKNVYEDESSRHIEIELPRRKHPCPCCGQRQIGFMTAVCRRSKTSQPLARMYIFWAVSYDPGESF